jgi:oligopeptidase B
MNITAKNIAIIAISTVIYSCGISNTEEKLSKKMSKAPIAEKKDSILVTHGDKRIDPYFWMRLTDEQKSADIPDEQTQKVINYLEAENQYTSSSLKKTEELQDKIYNEIVGRIKKDDNSFPSSNLV